MVLNREITVQIKSVLKENPQGLSIKDIVAAVDINRNTAGRYLENLLVSGQVEMRQLGMAKIYTLSQRVPVSAVLSISSELILQLDKNLRIIFANDPFLSFVSVSSTDLFGKNIEYSQVFPVFEEVYSEFIDRIRGGIAGTEWSGELALKERGIIFSCHIAPTVFDNGQKGVSVILKDISEKKRAEEALRESEGKLNAMLQSIPDHMSMMDKDLNILWTNETAKQVFGDNIVGKKCYEVYHRRQNPCEPYPCLTLRAFQDGQIHRHETSVIDIDGQTRFFECSANVAVNDESGKPVAVLEISRDITERKRVEKKMHESEDRYRTLVEISPDAIIVHQDGTILYANPSALALLNTSRTSEIVGRKLFDFIHPGSRDAIAANIEKDIGGGKTPTMETYMLRADGTTVTVEGRGIGILFDGKPAVQVAIRDVTERKRMEEVLKESEEKYRSVFDWANEAIMLHPLTTFTQSGRFIEVNAAACQMLGYSREELLTMGPADILPVELRSLTANMIRQAETQDTFLFETRLQRKDGTTFPVESNAQLVTFGGRRIWLSLIRDITERKHAEAALQESETRYRSLAEASQDLIFVIGKDDTVKYVNSFSAHLIGKQPDGIVGNKRSALFPSPVSDCQKRQLTQVFSTGNPSRSEGPMIIRNETRWFDHFLVPVRDKDGSVQSVLGISRDFTDRKKLEERLIESEQNFRLLAENSLDIITRMTPEIVCTYVSPAITSLLGYAPHEITGRSIIDYIHSDDAAWVRSDLKDIFAGKDARPTQFRIRHKNGDYLWFETVVRVIRDPQTGRVEEFYCVSRDITERKRAEAALLKSEERFRDLINTTADIVWQTDAEKRFVYVSPQVEKILGYTPDELVGRSPFEFLDPGTVELSQFVFDTAVRTHQNILLHESRWIDRDGNVVVMESHATPVYNSDGTCAGFRGIDRDITDR